MKIKVQSNSKSCLSLIQKKAIKVARLNLIKQPKKKGPIKKVISSLECCLKPVIIHCWRSKETQEGLKKIIRQPKATTKKVESNYLKPKPRELKKIKQHLSLSYSLKS